MGKEKDNVKGDHIVMQAGSMMVKMYQNNFPGQRGDWRRSDINDEDFVDYEEVTSCMGSTRKEEPNYFQTGRFLKKILKGGWFDDVRTALEYTESWRDRFVDDLLVSQWKDIIAEIWEDKAKRESLTGNIVGALKDAGVIAGSYDSIARAMGYEEGYRRLSRYMSRAKKQPFYNWIIDYMNSKHKMD